MPPDNPRIRGVSICRPIVYGSSAWMLTPAEKVANNIHPDHSHKWTVAVRSAASADDQVGGADDITHFIKRVAFKLHDSFPNPNRVFDKPPFEVSETGWGEFEIQIRITFVPESGEKAINTHHLLKLHPFVVVQQFKDNLAMQNQLPPPIQSWQYDEIVFTDPLQNFFNILIEHPPTLLPATKRRPIPYHISLPSNSYEADENSGDGKGGGVPAEFTQSMIKEEADRLQMAFNEVQTQIHKVFTLQNTRTRELEALKQQEAGGA